MSSFLWNLVEIPWQSLVEINKTHSSIYVLVAKNVTVCEYFALPVVDKEKSLCYARKGHKKSDHLNHHKSSIDWP